MTSRQFKPDTEIAQQKLLDEETLTISIEDTGIPYNPTLEAPPNYLDSPLEQRKIGGLGVYLAYQGTDKFLYERVGERNRNILIVNRCPSAVSSISNQSI